MHDHTADSYYLIFIMIVEVVTEDSLRDMKSGTRQMSYTGGLQCKFGWLVEPMS